MSQYTRFPNRQTRQHSSLPKGLKEHIADAEQLFRSRPAHPLTRDEKTAQVSKQIVLDETERRRTLSEALKSARLERAERFSAKTGTMRASKPDE